MSEQPRPVRAWAEYNDGRLWLDSDPTMPAGLAALLQEPGWRRHNAFGNQWTYLDGDLEIAVIWPECWLGTTDHIAVHNIGWSVPMNALRRIVAVADRIEAALAQEGTA